MKDLIGYTCPEITSVKVFAFTILPQCLHHPHLKWPTKEPSVLCFISARYPYNKLFIPVQLQQWYVVTEQTYCQPETNL